MIPFHIDDPPYIPCPCCRAQSTHFFVFKGNRAVASHLCNDHKHLVYEQYASEITKAEYLALVLEAKL